ncbi:hypothetical protein L2X99_00655 [Microbacterium sp. KUDC0406]|uniref:hypothetical protein n=1 Tax=Microbacterium sp. KUDC0406 TaxID=2909588 RepID=UPI001F45107B|nr:hypothetical protein [Microbacterium sp. KUDC0406]UJP10268.1 hypothetical protein L2X99_00655 [Microbacterium sp. KUDC0406]
MPPDRALLWRLKAQRPGIRFVGRWAPTRAQLSSAEQSLRIAAEVREAGADVVFVGSPLAGDWIARYGIRTGAGALLAFDIADAGPPAVPQLRTGPARRR